MARYTDLDRDRQKILVTYQYTVTLLIEVLCQITSTSKETYTTHINQHCDDFVNKLSDAELNAAIFDLDQIDHP